MAPVNQLDAPRAASPSFSRAEQSAVDDFFHLNDFDEEMARLAAANQELLEEFGPGVESDCEPASDADELELLRLENQELRACVAELEARMSAGGADEWLERQREYENLLEEKSEVIRGLHQKIQEMQETPSFGAGPPTNPGASGLGLNQAEEILRLKRELEERRQQLEQDEEDMVAQMRDMELTMARERADLARQRQEVQRLKAELTHEIETSSRSSELRDRLSTLRRNSDPKLADPAAVQAEKTPESQKGSGFFRRLFG